MATIGERLSEARKNFGIDIRSAAEATKIRRDFLAALEENQPEHIDLADVYKIGFLRIYAKYLKLDADRLVAEFRASLSMNKAHASHSGMLGGDRSSDDSSESGTLEHSGLFPNERNRESALSALFAPGARRILAIAVAVIVVIVAIFAIVKFSGDDASAAASSTTEKTAENGIQTYEFEIVSDIPQASVVIKDLYVENATAENERARVVVFTGPVSANRPTRLRGRGVLEIKDSAGNNHLKICFPSAAALRAAPAGEVVKFEKNNASKSYSSNSTHWVAGPQAD